MRTFAVALLGRLARFAHFHLVLQDAAQDLLDLLDLIFGNIQLGLVKLLLFRCFDALLKQNQFVVSGKNSPLFENVDVVFKVLDSSFLYPDVFLGKLEHVLQFL